MNSSNSSAAPRSNRSTHPRPGSHGRPVAQPNTRAETLELCELLEANLQALRVLHEEHRRTIALGLRSTGAARGDIQRELRALGDVRAPWVQALSESRALLFVALRELVGGPAEAEATIRMPAQPTAELRYRTR